MTTAALAMPRPAASSTETRTLRLLDGGAATRRPMPWWERRSVMRTVVGGCPDHWWKPTARRTAACTCDRF